MILVFACVIIGHQLVLLLLNRRFDPFDVRVLIDVVLLTMWVYAPLAGNIIHLRLEDDLGFGLTTLLGILALYIGLHLPGWRRTQSPQWLSCASVSRMRWLRLASFVFVLAALLAARQKIDSGGGLWAYLTGERISAYRVFLNEENEGSTVARIISFTQPVVLVWLALTVEKRRWRLAVFLYLIFLAETVLVSVGRLPIIITLLIPIFYYYRRGKMFGRVPVLIGVSVIVIALLFVLNIWRTRGMDSLMSADVSLSSIVDSVGANFSPLTGYEKLWQLDAFGSLPYEYGLSYVYVPLTAIPRALWESKPLVSFEPRWTTYFFGQHFATSSEGTGVWTFTAWGEGLAQFGVVGVFLNLFLFGSLVAWAESWFGKDSRFSFVWFYYSVLAATYLRSSVSALAWTSLATFAPLLLIWYLSTRQRGSATAVLASREHNETIKPLAKRTY
jgi:oligosaccharide repeat unit polymerase